MAGRFGLLGEKLSHSFSPFIHSMLQDYEYKLYPVPAHDLHDFMTGTDLDGFNVTIPYKEKVLSYCSSLSPGARVLGNVNTIVRKKDGSFYGDNTDYYGFLYLLKTLCTDISGRKAVVLGSGGASKTVCAVLKDQGAYVYVISRSGENNYENLHLHYDADILVNATPLGMYPENGKKPVDLTPFKELSAVFDLIYNPHRTALLLQAETLRIPAANGLAMLVAQAKAAAEVFTGISIDDGCIDEITHTISTKTRNILLIGMPGCGKSTIGRRLSQLTGRALYDTDALIEEKTGMAIPQFIEKNGEAAFRKVETEVFSSISKECGNIISAGGGIITIDENYSYGKENSIIVFIRRDIDKLPVRGRPLSQREGVYALYEKRRPLYMKWADIIVDNVEVEKTCSAILKEVSL